MSLRPQSLHSIPEETQRVAQAAFPKGTLCLLIADELGPLADVMVDPSHLSCAFEIAVRQLTKQIGSESTIAIEIGRGMRREGAGLEVEFHLRQPNEASPLFRTAEAGLEWAVAQKFVNLHGGELLERSVVPGEKELVLFLPLCR